MMLTDKHFRYACIMESHIDSALLQSVTNHPSNLHSIWWKSSLHCVRSTILGSEIQRYRTLTYDLVLPTQSHLDKHDITHYQEFYIEFLTYLFLNYYRILSLMEKNHIIITIKINIHFAYCNINIFYL